MTDDDAIREFRETPGDHLYPGMTRLQAGHRHFVCVGTGGRVREALASAAALKHNQTDRIEP